MNPLQYFTFGRYEKGDIECSSEKTQESHDEKNKQIQQLKLNNKI